MKCNILTNNPKLTYFNYNLLNNHTIEGKKKILTKNMHKIWTYQLPHT